MISKTVGMFFWHALVFLVFTCSASLHDHCMCFSFPWCIGVPHLLNAETSFSPTGNVFSGPVYPLLPAATNPTCHKACPHGMFLLTSDRNNMIVNSCVFVLSVVGGAVTSHVSSPTSNFLR